MVPGSFTITSVNEKRPVSGAFVFISNHQRKSIILSGSHCWHHWYEPPL